VPLAGLDGSIAGTNVHGSISGAGDSSYQLGILLKGGPALSISQFENYKPASSLGLSLTIIVPTGSYNAEKILNLGSNRWSFKPDLAFNHPFGPDQKWDSTATVTSLSTQTIPLIMEKRSSAQQPLPGLEGHISYSFNDRAWVSVDTRCSFGATTYVDSVSQNNAQQNFIVGNELNISLSPQTR
jgi:hypothetical protein